MAKASKIKKNNNDKKALKYFTQSSVYAVEEALRNVELEDLIHNIYVQSPDEDISYFIKQYEMQLVLSKVNHEKFIEGLHDFYLRMAEHIKEKGLYKKFFKLVYDMYIVLCKKDAPSDIITGYQDLLIQQFPYFTGSTKKVVYGIDNKGKLMICDEIGKNLTEINYELIMYAKKNKTDNVPLVEFFNKFGYKHVKDYKDSHDLIARDQIITNMIYEMSYFITEDTKSLFPNPYKNPVDLLDINKIFLETSRQKEVRDKLTERQILLPIEGLTVKLRNCGETTELYFVETMVDDTIVLLWKAKMKDNTYTMGYYDTCNLTFYSMWKDSSHDYVTHNPLENIILQNYMYLTCSLTAEEKNELYWFEETKNIKSEDTKLPLASYEYRLMNNNPKLGSTQVRHFDRTKYIADLMKINPFLRNLPMGSSASEEAIKIAHKMGIELPKGKTIVRGFQKNVWHNN